MSYQQQQHRLNEFVPTYVVKSDYLPNKVVDNNINQAQQYVTKTLILVEQLRGRKEKRTRLHSKTSRVQSQ